MIYPTANVVSALLQKQGKSSQYREVECFSIFQE